MKQTYLITGKFDEIDSMFTLLSKRQYSPNLEIDSYGNSTIVVELDSFQLSEVKSIRTNNRLRLYISSYTK